MQLLNNTLMSIEYDSSLSILKLTWKAATAAMTEGDFKESLLSFAAEVERHASPLLLVDVRQFHFAMTGALAEWRINTISPRYNRAGVRKFAFLLPEGSQMPSGPARGEEFDTQVFGREEDALEWLRA